MSNEVHTLVKRRVVGSPTLKSVLLYMADAAADDGSGIWMAKGTIAADLEFKSKRTVQTALATLTEMGGIEHIGHKKCRNGFTMEYKIVLAVVARLPQTRPSIEELTGAGGAPLPQHVGGAGNAPKPYRNHKGTYCG